MRHPVRKHLITAWILTALLAAAGGCASAAPAPLTGSAMQGVWSGAAYKHHQSVPVPYTLRITQASGDSFRGTATNPAARFTIEGTVRGNAVTVDFGRGVTWQGTVIGNVWKGTVHLPAVPALGAPARNWPFRLVRAP